MEPDQASRHPRIDWADFAKGICIIAVVAMYATRYVEDMTQQQSWMHYFTLFARPFRMPDFFFLSGLFVSRVINRQWRPYLDTKVFHFMYFYTLWIAIKFAFGNSHWKAGDTWLNMLSNFLYLYIQPTGPLWFIFMLALFFITVRLLRPLPVIVVFVLAVALHLSKLQTEWSLVNKFSWYFIFFYSGHLFAPYVFRIANRARNHIGSTLVILAMWFVMNAVVVWSGLINLPGVPLVAGYVGALAIILLSVTLMDLSWMGWLRYLGANSIVVFLGFTVPLAIQLYLVSKFNLIGDVGTAALIITIISIAVSVLMYWVLRRTPLNFLYSRPDWIKIKQPSAVPI